MDSQQLPWALVLLGSSLILALDPAPVPEAPEKLCGHHFVRALVRVCGGPRWSPEVGQLVAGGDRELLQWLDRQHILHGLVANGDPMLVLNLQPLPQASHHHHRHRRAGATNPARHCCLSGCTWQDLLTLCPH